MTGEGGGGGMQQRPPPPAPAPRVEPARAPAAAAPAPALGARGPTASIISPESVAAARESAAAAGRMVEQRDGVCYTPEALSQRVAELPSLRAGPPGPLSGARPPAPAPGQGPAQQPPGPMGSLPSVDDAVRAGRFAVAQGDLRNGAMERLQGGATPRNEAYRAGSARANQGVLGARAGLVDARDLGSGDPQKTIDAGLNLAEAAGTTRAGQQAGARLAAGLAARSGGRLVAGNVPGMAQVLAANDVQKFGQDLARSGTPRGQRILSGLRAGGSVAAGTNWPLVQQAGSVVSTGADLVGGLMYRNWQ